LVVFHPIRQDDRLRYVAKCPCFYAGDFKDSGKAGLRRIVYKSIEFLNSDNFFSFRMRVYIFLDQLRVSPNLASMKRLYSGITISIREMPYHKSLLEPFFNSGISQLPCLVLCYFQFSWVGSLGNPQ
jgi:hypothetical protein